MSDRERAEGLGMRNPRKVSRDELAATLRWMAELIDEDDSMEGSIVYGWSEEPGVYLIDGAARFGNQLGQGSIRLFGELARP